MSGPALRVTPRAWPAPLAADLAALALATAPLDTGVAVAYGALVLAHLTAQGAYRRRLTGQVGAILQRLVASACVPAVAVGAVAGGRTAGSLLTVVPFVLLALVLGRTLAAVVMRTLVERFGAREPAIVLGAGPVAVRIAGDLEAQRRFGIRPVAFLDDVDADDELPLPLLGGIDDLDAALTSTGAQHVIVAFGKASEPEVVRALRATRRDDVSVWVVPRLFDLGCTGPGGDADEVWGTPLVRMHDGAHRSPSWPLKRGFDVVTSSLLLAIAAPLMAAIAAAVKLTSAGPVLFRQQRVGQDGRTIEVLKFRTLRVNDDHATTWNVTADERVTAVGRVLRPTSLDELPQLLNVLRGDMTLVGPRPERPHFAHLFGETVPGYDDRHRVPVGLTGLAQVNGLRGDTSIEDRARFDNRYIDSWSLWGDLVILARTVWTVLRPPAPVRIEPARREVDIDLTVEEETTSSPSPRVSSLLRD